MIKKISLTFGVLLTASLLLTAFCVGNLSTLELVLAAALTATLTILITTKTWRTYPHRAPSPDVYVREFHTVFNVPIKNTAVKTLDPERAKLRLSLVREEFEEFEEALLNDDVIETADALADLTYVIYGTAQEFGIPLDDVLAEVHASNMSKLDENGKPIYREDGKVLKSQKFFRPDIRGVLYGKDNA